MFTAISSLNLHQTFLDVIADNLANANTTGYKSSRVIFQDQFAQIMSPGAAPSANNGGINPIQVGLGVQLGFVSPVFTQGMLQSTGRSSDLAIQGDGFFIYDQGINQRYSRDGSLDIDANGYLVNSSTGLRVQGWQVTSGSTVNTNQPISSINIPLDSTMAQATSNAILGGNLSAATTAANPTAVPPVPGGTVDTTFGIYDSLGNLHSVSVRFTRQTGDATAGSDWGWAVTNPAGATGTGTVHFNTAGQIVINPAASTAITIPSTAGSGAGNTSLNLNFADLTMLSASNSVSMTGQDGLAPGTVSDLYAAPNTGEIHVVYSNGLKQLVGQLALARFTNPSGLLRDGHNLFEAGFNSGAAQVGIANSGGRGVIASGFLESSNVDMAQEFTNMILAQRGFQASTRVINTSDEILQELVNLKR
jgi:flagellar hook protein FlgE